MSTRIYIDADQLERVINALDNRAKKITQDTDELRTLFDCSESIGPLRHVHWGQEVITFKFTSVSAEKAIKILRNQNHPTLRWLGNELDQI
jgi:hypothetical protein